MAFPDFVTKLRWSIPGIRNYSSCGSNKCGKETTGFTFWKLEAQCNDYSKGIYVDPVFLARPSSCEETQARVFSEIVRRKGV
jgi:hypothetical protein